MTTTGTLAVTESPDVFSATGSIFISCLVAISEVADNVAILGDVPATAFLAVTEQPDVFSGIMFLPLMGAMATTEAPDIFAASIYDFMFTNGAFVSSSVGSLGAVTSSAGTNTAVQSRVN